MHNSNTLQLSSVEVPHIPDEAFSCMTCINGKAAVQMIPPPKRMGSLLVPDTVGGKLRPDVGVVISNGPKVKVSLRDAVLVRPYDGLWLEGFEAGGYKTDAQVRMYGIAAEPSLYQVTNGEMGEKSDTGVHHSVPWSESIVAKFTRGTIIPTEGNILVRVLRKEIETLLLPDSVNIRLNQCIVEAISETSDFRRGECVTFAPNAELDLSISFYGEDDLFIIRESQIQARVEQGH